MSVISLDELKKQYEEFKLKYELPSFEELNHDFEIEGLQEKETDMLSKEIRRCLADRNASYLRFIDTFQNPTSAPMFFFTLIKNINEYEKKILNEMYLELGKFEFKSITLDNEYDEQKDAEFIKEFYGFWQELKKKFKKIMIGFEESWERKVEKKDKGYLG
ncbi:MAG: hypothetical protein ABIG37_02595 [Nanoarchaeota archaeon]